MESKNNEQIKLEAHDWQLTNALVGILGVLAPAACLAFIIGNSSAFLDFILSIDHAKPKVPPHHFQRWLTTLLLWPLRHGPHFTRPNLSQRKRLSDPLNPKHVWRNGSLLCTLVNAAVPGACRDPRQHWMQPPKHGLKLVMEYLDIQPIFTHDELNQEYLTPQQDRKFSKYLHEIHKLISKQIEIFDNMRFSTDYVARGMGLVIGEQNRKSTFYIYPIPKQNQQPCDLDIIIKGPCGNNGHIVIPSILHFQQKWQPPTEYRRAMYMSSKLNSISPTTQGTSFLRRLSLTPMTRIQDPNLEIDIRVKISRTRAKITYVPQNTGIYEIKLVTRNCHVVGSPYSVPIELPSSTYQSHNSSNESDEENEGKYIKRKKKIISRIVDFIDEKMLLQNDGTLVKIDDGNNQNSEQNKQSKNNLECVINIKNKKKDNKLEVVTPKTRLLTRTSNGQIPNLKVNTFLKTSSSEAIKLEAINNSEQIVTNKENIATPTVTNIATSLIKQINESENSQESIEKSNKSNKNIIEGESSTTFTENKIKQNKEFPEINESIAEIKQTSFLSNFEINLIDSEEQTNAYCNKIPDKCYIKSDFKETLDKFNKNISKQENQLLFTNNQLDRQELLLNENNVNDTDDNSEKDFKISIRLATLLTSSDDTKSHKTKNNTFEENLLEHNIPNKESNPVVTDKYSELSFPNKLEENNNNNISNNAKLFENKTEPAVLEEIINIENFNFFAPDILESSNKNDEKSTPFKENINDEQISHTFTTKYALVNPTFSRKVHDPTLYFPPTVSDYKKMFSKKDPSKELISFEHNFNNTHDIPYKVNNLIKVFDMPSKVSNKSSSKAQKLNLQNCTIPTTSENGPDLVKCHIQKPNMSNTDNISYSFQNENESLIQKKLKSLGALSEEFDAHQCYLKSCLQQNFVQHMKDIKAKRIDQHQEMQKNIKIKNTSTLNRAKLGIVGKQKQFWNQKIDNDDETYFVKPEKQKDSFISKTKEEAEKKLFTDITKNEADKDSLKLLCFKPFEGIVETNIKIFETKSSPVINSKTNFVRIYDKVELQKSKSESFLRIPEENKIFQIQKSVSNEEIIKIPSIEERKNKFLQACQPSCSSTNKKISEKNLDIRLDGKNEEPTSESITHIQNLKTDNHNLIIPLNEISNPKIQNPTKKPNKLSFKRKVRFKRAKIFFHHLEGSDPKINNDELLENLSESNKISRSESDSCVSYHRPTTTPTKSIKISDRFQVDDLFQDILGDDKRFIGIPNKMAVVASLASLDSDSSRAEYDSGNEGEPDLDYFTGTSKKIKRRMKTIPGFHEEFPYPPNTDTWQYKSRNDTRSEELIPGRVLLTKSETDLNYK